MESILKELRSLRVKGFYQKRSRGNSPVIRLGASSWKRGLQIFFLVLIISFVFFFFYMVADHTFFVDFFFAKAFFYSWNIATSFALFYYIFPVIHLVILSIWKRKIPTRDVLQKFSIDQKFISASVPAFLPVYLFSHAYPIANFVNNYHQWPNDWVSMSPYFDNVHFAPVWFCVTVVVALIFPYLLPRESRSTRAPLNLKFLFREPKIETLPFCVWLGRSTGYLSKLWHVTGMAPDINVVLSLEDAAQNLLVLGGIGSGKTTRVMQPLLAQLLDQNCGGLLFDVKGDVKGALNNLSIT